MYSFRVDGHSLLYSKHLVILELTLPKGFTSNQAVHEKQHFSICGKQRGQNQTKAEAFNLLESASQRFQTISEELR
jgi:hypothetical protein